MSTTQEYIEKYRLTMKASPLPARTDGLMEDEGMIHWAVEITATTAHGSPAMTITYSHGPGVASFEIDDVLDCLGSDSSGVLNARDFEDWASEYGYDTDSRRAERTYMAIRKQMLDLERLVGRAGVDELAFSVERE